MKYFRISPKVDIKETGKYPQSTTCKEHGDTYKINKIEGEIKSFNPPEPILDSKSRPTSYLHSIPVSYIKLMIINDNLMKFIVEFGVNSYQMWKAKIHHRKKVLKNYFFFYLTNSAQERYVDYAKSKFYIGKLKDWKFRGDSIKVKDYNNYKSIFELLHNDGYWLKCDELVFDFSSANEDLLRLTDIPFGHGYYVSERLKNAMEKERFTGMAFKEIEDHNKRIKVIY